MTGRIPDNWVTTADLRGSVTTARIGTFDPGELGPEARAQWELLCRRMEVWDRYDAAHPLLGRLSGWPIVGRWYWRRRRDYILRTVQ